MWGAILSGLGKAGSFLKSDAGKKVMEVGAGLAAGKLQDSGAKKANALEAAVGGRDILTTPVARRDAIAQDENVAGSMRDAGSLGNTMADRTQNQALKLAILQGANMGGVSAPSFLAGKTGSVSGPQWSPEQIAALRSSWDSGNANVQRSIDSLQARGESPLNKMVMDAAMAEDARIRDIMPKIQQQAMESGIMGSEYEKKTPWWQKYLLPAAGIAGGAALLGKYGSKTLGPESKISGPSIESIIGMGKALPPEAPPDTGGMIWNSKAKLGKTGWGGK